MQPGRSAIAMPRRLGRDRRGYVAVVVAIALPVLIGFAGLGVDTGLWYTMKRQNQSAADFAATSAAYEVIAGNTANLTAAATEAARQNGWVNNPSPPPGLTPITVTYPYNDANITSGVRVILQQRQNSVFAGIANVKIETRAVAAARTLGPACITALAPTGIGISVIGSANINTPNCTLVALSNAADAIFMQGGNNARITALTLVTAGQLTMTGNPVLTLSQPAQFGAPPSELVNPYAPNGAGNCPGTPCLTHAFLTTGLATAPACTGSPLIGNCVIAGGMLIKNQTVNLSPGTYWVTDGDLIIGPNGVLECTACNGSLGVTIIFTTKQANGTIGTLLMNANAKLNSLNAPNSGTFSGLFFVQDTVAGATYTAAGTMQGGPNANFTATGLIYFPHTNMVFQGTPTLATNGCLVLVANTIILHGNPTLAAAGCTAAGLGSVPTIQTVALVE